MSARPGEIPPPAEAEQREIFERTGVCIGRKFAVMRDGAYAGYAGLATAVSPAGVTWRWSYAEEGVERESVETFSNERVAWWIN